MIQDYFKWLDGYLEGIQSSGSKLTKEHRAVIQNKARNIDKPPMMVDARGNTKPWPRQS